MDTLCAWVDEAVCHGTHLTLGTLGTQQTGLLQRSIRRYMIHIAIGIHRGKLAILPLKLPFLPPIVPEVLRVAVTKGFPYPSHFLRG